MTSGCGADMAHIPGPWTIEDDHPHPRHGIGGHWVIRGADDEIVAETWREDDRDPDTARILAASLDLLAACRAYVKLFDDTYDGAPMSINEYDAIEMMRAAIAKAGG
jgi:hypothetical protein